MKSIKIMVPSYVDINDTKWTDGEYLLFNTLLEFARLNNDTKLKAKKGQKTYYNINRDDMRNILNIPLQKKLDSYIRFKKLREVVDIRVINEYNIEIRLISSFFYAVPKKEVTITDPDVIKTYYYLCGRMTANVFNESKDTLFHVDASSNISPVYKNIF